MTLFSPYWFNNRFIDLVNKSMSHYFIHQSQKPENYNQTRDHFVANRGPLLSMQCACLCLSLHITPREAIMDERK